MGGAIKGNRERITILAHQIEAMARQKRLLGLAHYLGSKKPKSTNSDVINMLDGLAAKGKGVTVRRIKRER